VLVGRGRGGIRGPGASGGKPVRAPARYPASSPYNKVSSYLIGSARSRDLEECIAMYNSNYALLTSLSGVRAERRARGRSSADGCLLSN
jgi:hypothetical protein